MNRPPALLALAGCGLLIAACGSQPVPDVVGMNPQEAIDAMHEAGYKTNSHGGIGSEEGLGFVVCRTEPVGGGSTGGKVEIYSRKSCEAKSAKAKADIAANKKAASKPDGNEARYIRKLRTEVRGMCAASSADTMCAIARKLKYADDLDPWDGSLAVTAPMKLYNEEADDVAGIVMGASFAMDEGGLCIVDVRQPDGRRVVEHKSQARDCL